mmetsp:Transcript_6512/g.29389  ORF Transcript_6512/g.29389 Transcript_6512/m.29389 type:complete len:239 (+) Transcript_6512:611-1327(+)
MLVRREVAEHVGVQPLVDAVPQFLLVELRGSHVEPLENFKHEIGLRLFANGLHVERVVQYALLDIPGELVEAQVVVFVEHVESLELERRAVGKRAFGEAPDGRQSLLPVDHFEASAVDLVEKHRRDRDVQHERLHQLRRRLHRPHVLALVARPQVYFAAVDLVDDGVDREVCFLDLEAALPVAAGVAKEGLGERLGVEVRGQRGDSALDLVPEWGIRRGQRVRLHLEFIPQVFVLLVP